MSIERIDLDKAADAEAGMNRFDKVEGGTMSTIMDRFKKFAEGRSELRQMEALIEEFVRSERALQRQECMDAADVWLIKNHGQTFPGIRQAILTAGVEPQGPFGCEHVESQNGYLVLMVGEAAGSSANDFNYCPKCGKPRRER